MRHSPNASGARGLVFGSVYTRDGVLVASTAQEGLTRMRTVTSPVKPVPLFPENLGPANNRTVALPCNPKNVHVGIWRQIRLESFRDVSAGVLRVVATLRFDARFAEEPGVAKLINIQL